MRKAVFSSAKGLYKKDEINKINEIINERKEIKNFDSPAKASIKTSELSFIRYSYIASLLNKFLGFCMSSNVNYFGFDLFPINFDKVLTFNTYNQDNEYSWHIDADSEHPVRDIKLTAMINCSEEKYEGGELVLFKGSEVKCPEFEEPGSAIVFPSFTNHKVNKVLSGKRKTLAMWMRGPKFR